MNGWIKLHRQIIDWEWYDDANTFRLFIHLLLLSNHEEKKWQGTIIKRGQCIIGRKKLSKTLKISQQSLRTSLTRLKSTSEITSKSTNKFSIITIINWEQYQAKDKKSTSKSTKSLTSNQPAINQQSTTPKEDKNVKKDTPPKISFLILEAFKEIAGITTPDGDYKMDNIFPAIRLAKKIKVKYEEKEKGEITDDKILKGFKWILNGMDEFHKKNATSIKYINNNFIKIVNSIK